MVQYEKWIDRIKKVLKENPRGMTVTEISRNLGLSRNSVSKYLELLRISGQVEMKRFGPSKVFFPSQRVPISAMLNFSHDNIVVLDQDMRINQVNETIMKLFSLRHDSIVGRPILDSDIPVLSDPDMKRYLKRAKNGSEQNLQREFRIPRRSLHFNIKMLPTTLGDGENGVTVIMEDITQRKEIEQELIESEKKYRTLFENSSDAILLMENDRFIDFNQAALDMFCIPSRAELMRCTPLDLSPPKQLDGKSSREKARELISRAKNGEDVNFEWIHRRVNSGEKFYAYVTLSSIEMGESNIIQATVRDIDTLKRTRFALEKNERRMRSILSSLYESYIGLIDKEGVLTRFWGTKELDERYGIRTADMVGKKMYHFAPEKNHDEIRENLKTLFETGRPFRFEYLAHFPKGNFWKDLTFSPITEDNGEITNAVVFGRDTTDTHRAMEEYKEMNRKYRFLNENISDVIWIMNGDFQLEYVTSSIRELIGYDPEELKAKNMESIATEESIEHGKALLEEWIHRPERWNHPLTFEMEFVKKNGENVWTESRIMLKPRNGAIDKILGTTRDISRRKRAQEERDRFYHAVRISNDGITVTDMDGRIIDANESFARMVSADRKEDVIGIYGPELIVPEDKDYALKSMNDIPMNLAGRGEYDIKRRDGKRITVDTSATVIRNNNGEPLGFVTIVRDITDRQITWRNLKRLERILSAVGRSSRYLLRKEDSRETLRSLLSDLGQSVDVSRVYIFRHVRITDEEVISSQIMEWTSRGIESESDNPELQDFPMIDGGFQRWVDTLERGDPVYGNVNEFPEGEQKILKPQGIKSILVVPLFIERSWWGFVGFDDCVRKRKWMDEEIAALTTASRLIENVIVSKDSS